MPLTKNTIELLYLRLAGRGGSWLLGLALIVVWSIDHMLARVLLRNNLINPGMLRVDQLFESTSRYVFLTLTLLLLFALIRKKSRLVITLAGFYLSFAVLQLIVVVFSMVLTAHISTGVGLAELWDIAGVYAMSVLIFMLVYVFIDVSTPGGAFVWPSRQGEEPPEPHLLDYLFISLNVNSTYGPTSEAVMSRRCKLVMALQTLLSILMLTVLIARAVGATS